MSAADRITRIGDTTADVLDDAERRYFLRRHAPTPRRAPEPSADEPAAIGPLLEPAIRRRARSPATGSG